VASAFVVTSVHERPPFTDLCHFASGTPTYAAFVPLLNLAVNVAVAGASTLTSLGPERIFPWSTS